MNHEEHEGHEGLRIRSPLSAETERVITSTIGCALAVHRTLGPGFLESIYKRAMHIELTRQGLAFAAEQPLIVTYRDVPIRGQRVDLIVAGVLLVELKAVRRLDDIHTAQVISYLRTTGLRAGLLINFHVGLLKDGLKRIVL